MDQEERLPKKALAESGPEARFLEEEALLSEEHVVDERVSEPRSQKLAPWMMRRGESVL